MSLQKPGLIRSSRFPLGTRTLAGPRFATALRRYTSDAHGAYNSIASDSPTDPLHLLSHIYVSRSESLWKEPPIQAWFESTVRSALPTLESADSAALRSDALAMMHQPRDPLDQALKVPMHICRHVLCSESTSFVGYLPPVIRNKPVHAYDPLPPSTVVSMYDAEYFNGVRAGGGRAGRGAGAGVRIDEGFLERIMGAVQAGGEGWRDRVGVMMRELTGGRDVPLEQREGLIEQVCPMFTSVNLDRQCDRCVPCPLELMSV